jgi:hypothetical protein
VIVSLPEQLGYRARKVRRALIRNGRVRGMTLIGWDQTKVVRDKVVGDMTGWDVEFRNRYPGAGALSEDDLALSLAWGGWHEPPGSAWPSADLRRSYEHIASFASPEPEDMQAARELIELGEPLRAVELAQEVIREWLEATPMERRRWQINQERLDIMLDALREDR